MGRFAGFVILLLAACGDNSGSDGVLGGGPDNSPGGVTDTNGTSPRYLPAVCSSESWTTVTSDRIVDLSVAGQTDRAAILGVSQTGGDVTGFVLDTRMRMVSGEQKIAITEPLTQIAVSFLGGRIASTGIANGSVYLHLLDDDLTNPQLVTKMPATTISKPAFWQTQADIVMPAGTEEGLFLYRFQDSGEPVDALRVASSKPVRSMASAQLGVSLVTAWSTDGECYVMQNAAYAPGELVRVNAPCPSPSLAINSATGHGALVFDGAEGVSMMLTQGATKLGQARLLRPDSTSPRALFDGTNMWISYLDARGDVIVGFLDANNHLVSMSLSGPKPYDTSYQLAMVEGAPWVFALDDNGYSGHRLCVETQW